MQSTLSLLDLFKMGGAFMWPLLAFSIAATAIALERVIFVLSRDLKLDDIRAGIQPFIEQRDFRGCAEYLKSFGDKKIGAGVFLAILRSAATDRRAGMTGHFMEKAGETEALARIAELENGFNYLTALGSIAPLTGFLGTVSGMIGAFKSIAEATEVNAQIVANGIYEALITTVFGLIIAIIAMVAHSILSNVVDGFASNVEKSCSDVIFEIAARALPAPNPAAQR